MARSSQPGFNRYGQPVDSQRKKVYRFEHTYNHYKQTMTLEQCKAFVDELISLYPIDGGIQKIWVVAGRGGRGAKYMYYEQRMVLNTSCMNKLVVVHEFVHAIIGCSGEHAGHGPHFVNLMLNLQLLHAKDEATRPWADIIAEARLLGFQG